MSKSVGSYHMKAFVFIKNLIRKYGQAFPSIPTLAKVAGCSERYMTTIINDLAEWGHLKKVPRYNLNRQLSNGYEILKDIEEETVHKEPEPEESEKVESVHPIKDSLKAVIQAPIKASKSFKTAFNKTFIKTEEEDTTPTRTRVQSEYQMWFLRDAVDELGTDAAKAIFPYVKPLIDTTKPLAWYNAIQQFKANIHQAKTIGPFFKTILKNEILKHQVLNMVRNNEKTAIQPSW